MQPQYQSPNLNQMRTKTFEDDVMNVKTQSLYARLKRLFSTDVIVRNVGGKQLKIKDTDSIMYATDRNSLRDRFNRIRSTAYNAYTRDFSLSYQAARMDLFRDYDCIGPDTIIPLPDGSRPTIKELSEKYKNSPQERFWVFSYDQETKSIKLGRAYHPRKKKGKRLGYKVTFDNGQYILGSLKHPFYMRDGSVRRLFELRVGDSILPFYWRDENIYDFSNGWQPECKIIAGQYNFNGSDNLYTIEKSDCKRSITLDNVEEVAKTYLKEYSEIDISDFIKHIECDRPILTARGEIETTLNHKIISIECVGKIDVYDVTVEKYSNFATDSCIVGNTMDLDPIICSALDIYSDECLTTNEVGNMITVHSNNNNVKRILENLFDEILNARFNLWSWVRNMPIKYDSYIPLMSGENIRIDELSERIKSGKEVWVYSVQNKTNEIVPGKVVWCDKNYTATKIAKIILDDDSIIETALEHPFIMRDGTTKMAGELQENDSLMPFYRKLSSYDKQDGINSYEKIYDPSINDYKYTHRVVTKSSGIDENKETPVKKHKVKRIEIVNEIADVYCMTVVGPNGEHDRHNFAVCGKTANGSICKDSGVFVKNCKYGDFYLKLYITPEYGIYMVEPISAYNVERIENSDPYNKRYVKFQIRPTDTAQSEVLENYQMAHFRLISDSNFLPYGKSLIEGSRRVWKQLSLMEDAMLIHRIMRAPEKRVFYTDTGNLPPNEIDTHVQNMMNKMKKVPYIDENTGDYNLRFNLQNMVEDFYIPVRGGDSGTKIDTLGGMEWTGTEDIEYLRNKLMASLKIPKAFLGYDETVSGKATLASEDVRFARTIQRLQRIIISELSKIAIVHLYAQGYRDETLIDFELELTNPSTIFEKEKIEIWSDKISVATDMVETKFFSYNWAYKNIFNMSEDDIKMVREEVVEDAKQKFRFDSIENDGDDPAKPFAKIKGGGKDGEGSGGLDNIGGGLGGLGGGDLDSLEDEGELGDLGDLGDSESDEEEEEKDMGKNEPPSKLSEYADPQENRDQTGKKEASEYSFGEDPLGEHERNSEEKKSSEGTRTSKISHNFEGGTPLSLGERLKAMADKEMISDLAKFLSKTHKETKAELLIETQISSSNGNKSLLDESNIIE